ncbi:DUF3649 domain-containing protein [Marinobacterium marinum]|uniref:DUF3649 domain-containing protein n=1 Tax=Marinobacterium marinum TaxID=2756129 RepID=A0A7W1WZT3_9GAMM|nr:DUF3649 domain-containing protein [Marinobacterium marinum]MBA4503255.1 DUF3649 domain-containing protein [Marinobacterium marinum]
MPAKVRFHLEPLLRTLFAILSAFLLTRWSSIAVLALPWAPEQAVLTGMLLAFAVFAATVIWVFWAASLRSACMGLLLPTLLLIYVCYGGGV